MSPLFLIARLLFAAVFIIAPAQVVRSSAEVANAPPLRRVPQSRLSVIAMSGVAIVAGVLVSLGVWPDLGALLIVVYLVPVTLVIHPFWTFDEPALKKQNWDSFLLNTCVLGGALILFWAVNQMQHVPAALISTPLFGRW
jgi:putative oxidoreductase